MPITFKSKCILSRIYAIASITLVGITIDGYGHNRASHKGLRNSKLSIGVPSEIA